MATCASNNIDSPWIILLHIFQSRFLNLALVLFDLDLSNLGLDQTLADVNHVLAVPETSLTTPVTAFVPVSVAMSGLSVAPSLRGHGYS